MLFSLNLSKLLSLLCYNITYKGYNMIYKKHQAKSTFLINVNLCKLDEELMNKLGDVSILDIQIVTNPDSIYQSILVIYEG